MKNNKNNAAKSGYDGIMKLRHFSLEERVIEPFHAIRWIFISRNRALLTILALIIFNAACLFFRQILFQVWKIILLALVKFTSVAWMVQDGFWPNTTHPILTIPKLIAPVLAPTPILWWGIALITVLLWILTGTLKMSLLPIRTIVRFMMILIWISLACFAIAPLQFHHSVEEWSKVFFLSAYGSIFIYSAIWAFCVLWLPIPLTVKVWSSILLAVYFTLGQPILFFFSVMVLVHSSLVLLPFFALFLAPVLQLGWFVAFYSIALSSGGDGLAEAEAT